MTFLRTMLEEGKNPFKGNQLSLEDAARFVAKECRQSLNAAPIYTNGSGRFDAFMVHPTRRRPQNVLEVLVDDVLENWSTFPNRTQSLVGSGQPGAFRVFPVDGANMAYTNKPAFSEAFEHVGQRFGDMDIQMRNMMQIISNAYSMNMGKQAKEVPQNMTGPKMKDYFRMSDEIWKSPKHRNIKRILDSAGADEETRNHLHALLDMGDRKIGQGLETIFDPADTDIKATPIAKMPTGAGEVWTDAPAVLVRTDKLGNM